MGLGTFAIQFISLLSLSLGLLFYFSPGWRFYLVIVWVLFIQLVKESSDTIKSFIRDQDVAESLSFYHATLCQTGEWAHGLND